MMLWHSVLYATRRKLIWFLSGTYPPVNSRVTHRRVQRLASQRRCLYLLARDVNVTQTLCRCQFDSKLILRHCGKLSRRVAKSRRRLIGLLPKGKKASRRPRRGFPPTTNSLAHHLDTFSHRRPAVFRVTSKGERGFFFHLPPSLRNRQIKDERPLFS